MPVEEMYFCSTTCIKEYNSEQLRIENTTLQPEHRIQSTAGKQWADLVGKSILCPIRVRPAEEGEEDSPIDESCFLEGFLDARAPVSAESSHEELVSGIPTREASEAVVELDNENWEPFEEDHDYAFERGEDTLETGEEAGGERADDEDCLNATGQDAPPASHVISDQVLALTKEGVRIKLAFKQDANDEEGSWFGGLIGPTQVCVPLESSIVTVAYDDGGLVCHSLAELQVCVCGWVFVCVIDACRDRRRALANSITFLFMLFVRACIGSFRDAQVLPI